MASAVVLALASSSVALAHTISDRVLTLENGEVYTHVSQGKDFNKINGAGATLTLQAGEIKGDGAAIYLSASNPNNLDIVVKNLTALMNEQTQMQL